MTHPSPHRQCPFPHNQRVFQHESGLFATKHHIKAATTRTGNNMCLQDVVLHYHQQQTSANVGQ